jgi:hypothetical protein
LFLLQSIGLTQNVAVRNPQFTVISSCHLQIVLKRRSS